VQPKTVAATAAMEIERRQSLITADPKRRR
jgi:hypothetical protein